MTASNNNSNNVTRDELFALGSKLEQQLSVQTEILVNLATFETRLEERDKLYESKLEARDTLIAKVVAQQDLLQESLQKVTTFMAKAMGGLAVLSVLVPPAVKYFSGA